ncbi:hypothetical protein NECAME_10764 [Necator americanus]|uniref:Uncharacterized protein n=1 Tax=Necator americanus TaxID=51031 RepID=W2T734_NECAM|nr:hypothetical protein NECAME_10764 [Necator americanus]ETN77815.1 hypothetical protein NECAME_10764 [Necator americanus]
MAAANDSGTKVLSYPIFGLRNKYLEDADDDFLYHFGFGIKTVDIPKRRSGILKLRKGVGMEKRDINKSGMKLETWFAKSKRVEKLSEN